MQLKGDLVVSVPYYGVLEKSQAMGVASRGFLDDVGIQAAELLAILSFGNQCDEKRRPAGSQILGCD